MRAELWCLDHNSKTMSFGEDKTTGNAIPGSSTTDNWILDWLMVTLGSWKSSLSRLPRHLFYNKIRNDIYLSTSTTL